MKTYIFTHEGRTVKVHFNSPIPKALGVAAIVLSKDAIHVATEEISNFDLAHEWAHVIQSVKRSIGYLPWMLLEYARKKYAGAKGETDADRYAAEHVFEFPWKLTPEGPVSYDVP